MVRSRNRANFGSSQPGTGISLNPDHRPGQGIQGRKTASNCGDPSPQSGICDGRGKFLEKVVGDFFGGAVDQALAELGQLASDLRLDIVS